MQDAPEAIGNGTEALHMASGSIVQRSDGTMSPDNSAAKASDVRVTRGC